MTLSHTRIKHFVAALLLALVCALAAARSAGEDAPAPEPPRRYSRTIKKTLQWSAAQQVRVSETSGAISVRGYARDDIELKGIQTAYHKSLDTARDHVADVALTVESRPDFLRLYTRLPENWPAGLSGGIDMFLKIPEKAPLTLATITGGITVSDALGPLDARSVDGRVACSNVSGPVTIRTVTGEAAADGCSRTRSIRTLTGPVTVSLESLEDSLDISTVSGTVKLMLGRGVHARIVLSSSLGSIHTSGPDDFSGTRVVEKTYGQGTHAITVHTLTGNISVETPDEARRR